MMSRPLLLIIPFDDVLEEIEPLNSVLWFIDYGFKDIILNLLVNLTTEESKTFNEINLDDLSINLYGQTLTDVIISDFQRSIDTLDRCNATLENLREEEQFLKTIILQLTQMVEDKLKLILGDMLMTDIKADFKPFWNASRLVLGMKK